jgi:hypothetical protein
MKGRRTMTDDYDVNQPILLLVRRGRGGRGYLVAAVDDTANAFPCSDESEVGSSVIELLNDPKQPRFDENQLEDLEEEDLEDSASEDVDEDDDEEPEEEPEENEDPEPDPLDELGLDPGEKLLFQVGTAILGKARHLSNDYRHKRKSRTSKKRTKK